MPFKNPSCKCAISQKENKADLALLPGKVKETTAANSLTSKKWQGCSNGKKRNKSNSSNVKRKFRDLNQKGQT